MSHAVTLELSAEAYAALTSEAEARGMTPARVAAAAIEQRYTDHGPRSRAAIGDRLTRYFGSVSLGDASGADNDAIDADLAREYGGTE